MHVMDLDHPANCITFNVQRAARALGRGFEAAAKEAGLTAPQFSTLALLAGEGPLGVVDLADRIGTDRTTLTRNLQRMAAQGWIVSVGADDQRRHLFALAPPGQARLDLAYPAWLAWQRHVTGLLGEATARALLDTLQKV